MTAAALKKYRTYLTDENGKPVMVQLDLRNKEMRTFYEAWMEDLEDTWTAMERDDDDTISYEQVKARILAAQPKS